MRPHVGVYSFIAFRREVVKRVDLEEGIVRRDVSGAHSTSFKFSEDCINVLSRSETEKESSPGYGKESKSLSECWGVRGGVFFFLVLADSFSV